jgi:hypothetical protein
MLSPAASKNHQDSSLNVETDSEDRSAPMAPLNPLVRLLLWLARWLGLEQYTHVPVRVYYKFDSGCWRSRETQQLHKVYRCR